MMRYNHFVIKCQKVLIRHQYLQDTEQCCALEVNYFDDTTRSTNISSMSEATEQINESSEYNLP